MIIEYRFSSKQNPEGGEINVIPSGLERLLFIDLYNHISPSDFYSAIIAMFFILLRYGLPLRKIFTHHFCGLLVCRTLLYGAVVHLYLRSTKKRKS